MNRLIIPSVLLVFLLLVQTACESRLGEMAVEESITVSEPWVRDVPYGVENTAMYLNIFNNSGKSDVLLSVSSDAAKSAEIHRTYVDQEGITRMEMVDHIEIPASRQVILEPGGMHIMLIGLKEKLNAGDSVYVELEFEVAGTKSINAEVRGLDEES